jgi:hypothetical protein
MRKPYNCLHPNCHRAQHLHVSAWRCPAFWIVLMVVGPVNRAILEKWTMITVQSLDSVKSIHAGPANRGIIMLCLFRTAVLLASVVLVTSAIAVDNPYAEPETPGLPPSNMELDFPRVALVVTDPQIDFLSEKGVTWGLVGASVTQNKIVSNNERLFKAARKAGIPVMISPHYYYPTDHGWKFEGAL